MMTSSFVPLPSSALKGSVTVPFSSSSTSSPPPPPPTPSSHSTSATPEESNRTNANGTPTSDTAHLPERTLRRKSSNLSRSSLKKSKDVRHDLQVGDHVVRWSHIAMYPIQIHGIVLSSRGGKPPKKATDKENQKDNDKSKANDVPGEGEKNEDVFVTIADFGLTSVEEPPAASEDAAQRKNSYTLPQITNGKRRLNVIVLTNLKDIKKWKKVNYGASLFGSGSHNEDGHAPSSKWNTVVSPAWKSVKKTMKLANPSKLIKMDSANAYGSLATASTEDGDEEEEEDGVFPVSLVEEDPFHAEFFQQHPYFHDLTNKEKTDQQESVAESKNKDEPGTADMVTVPFTSFAPDSKADAPQPPPSPTTAKATLESPSVVNKPPSSPTSTTHNHHKNHKSTATPKKSKTWGNKLFRSPLSSSSTPKRLSTSSTCATHAKHIIAAPLDSLDSLLSPKEPPLFPVVVSHLFLDEDQMKKAQPEFLYGVFSHWLDLDLELLQQEQDASHDESANYPSSKQGGEGGGEESAFMSAFMEEEEEEGEEEEFVSAGEGGNVTQPLHLQDEEEKSSSPADDDAYNLSEENPTKKRRSQFILRGPWPPTADPNPNHPSTSSSSSSTHHSPPKLPKSDPVKLVLARVHYLLKHEDQPGVIPPYHVFYSNSECIAVWCKTGTWSTLQASIFLHSSAVGNAKTTFLTLGGIAAMNPLLIPVLAPVGVAYIGAPWLYLSHCKGKWEEATRVLTEGFWMWAGPEVFVEVIQCWSGLT